MDDNQKPQDTTKEPSAEPVQEETPVEETAPETETAEVKNAGEPQISQDEAKSETDKAISEVESAPESGTSEASDSQQTHSEAQSEPEYSEQSGPSGALQSDEPTTPATNEPSEEPTEEPGEPIQPKPSKSDNPNAKWYVVHTYSGHENKVAATLKQRIESEGLEKKILDILVPTQDKIEIRSGKKQTIKEKVFPGYILVKMDLDDISWLAVRTTQGVTSFVGIGNKPTPISDAEVQTIVRFTKEEAPSYKQVFAVSDTVKIVDGPFAEFIGKVDAVDEEKGKIRVLVSIFGRETPVELDFLQVQKI